MLSGSSTVLTLAVLAGSFVTHGMHMVLTEKVFKVMIDD
jgi:hypothetical protein